MKPKIDNDRGIALVVCLMIMALILSMVGVGLMVSGLNLRTASNYTTASHALQVADAGIQHAMVAIVPTGAFNYGTDPNNPAVVVPATPFPPTAYSYAVTAIDDAPNTRAILTSTATGPDGSRAVVQAVVEQRLFSFPATLTILGEAETYFNGDSFLIDGKDYKLDGTLSSLPDKLGIAIGDIGPPSFQTPATALSSLNGSLSSAQKDDVQGLGFVPPSTPSVGIDNSLSRSAVADLVNILRGSADNYLTLKSGGDITGPVSGNTDANGNLTIGSKTINLGTTSAPKITFIEGAANGIEADFRGDITGVGILVVNNNDLIFRGGVNWTGLVIVNGRDVGFGALGGGNTQGVLGGIVISETDTDINYKELYVTGNMTFRRSQEALDLVTKKISVRLIAWKQQF